MSKDTDDFKKILHWSNDLCAKKDVFMKVVIDKQVVISDVVYNGVFPINKNETRFEINSMFDNWKIRFYTKDIRCIAWNPEKRYTIEFDHMTISIRAYNKK